jgi:ribosomal protein S6E (S10)
LNGVMDILLCTPPSAYRPSQTGQRKKPKMIISSSALIPATVLVAGIKIAQHHQAPGF